MLPTPRTQPYRGGAPREITAALQAMLAGRQPGVVNPGDFARERSQMGAMVGGAGQRDQMGLQNLALQNLQQMQRQGQRDQMDLQNLALRNQQRRRPTATADVRGQFGGLGSWGSANAPGGGLHELLAGLMGAPAIAHRY